METITNNGVSTTLTKGQEQFARFMNGKTAYYQYDYRHKDGELFSVVAKSPEGCREKRDKWLQQKNFKRLFPDIRKKIQENKRLTKSEMGFRIGDIEPLHVVAISWDYFKRDEIVEIFNTIFGTDIK